MKKSSYWIGLIVVVVVVLVLSVAGHKPAVAPVTSSSASLEEAARVDSFTRTLHVKKGGATLWYSSPTTTVASQIHIDNPPTNTTATSPMSVSGQARGSWFFEGTMPIYLTDSRGYVLAMGFVRAQSDWTTDDLVPFLGKLTFPRQPTGSTGAFIIENSNPSGAAANQKSVQILVTFN